MSLRREPAPAKIRAHTHRTRIRALCRRALRRCRGAPLPAAALEPDNPEPYLFMGRVEVAAPRPLPCVAQKLAEFHQRDPGNALADYYFAMSLWKQQPSSADSSVQEQIAGLLREAVTADPRCGEAWLQLGNLRAQSGNYASAIPLYTKAVDGKPQLTEAYYRLGIAYDRTNQRDKAREALPSMTELRSNRPPKWNNNAAKSNNSLSLLPAITCRAKARTANWPRLSGELTAQPAEHRLQQSITFSNDQKSIPLDIREPLDLLRRWPLHLDPVRGLRFAQPKVQPQIALRHDACSAVYLVHLYVLARRNPHRAPMAVRLHLVPISFSVIQFCLVPTLCSSDGGSFMFRIRMSIPPSLSKSPNAAPRLENRSPIPGPICARHPRIARFPDCGRPGAGF